MPRIVGDQVAPRFGYVWNNVATGTSAPTTGVDTESASPVTIMGHGSGAATLNIYYSNDGITFYDTGQTIVLGGAADFFKDLVTAARYIGLKSSANITATAIVAGK